MRRVKLLAIEGSQTAGAFVLVDGETLEPLGPQVGIEIQQTAYATESSIVVTAVYKLTNKDIVTLKESGILPRELAEYDSNERQDPPDNVTEFPPNKYPAGLGSGATNQLGPESLSTPTKKSARTMHDSPRRVSPEHDKPKEPNDG